MYVNRRKKEMGERNQAASHSVNVVGQLKTELINTAKVNAIWALCLLRAVAAVKYTSPAHAPTAPHSTPTRPITPHPTPPKKTPHPASPHPTASHPSWPQ